MPLTDDDCLKVMQWAQGNPVAWIAQTFGVKLWDLQRQIMDGLRDNRRVAVAACHASGKTFNAACALLARLYPYPSSKIVSTAPTGRQVYSLLWSEVRTLHQRARDRGTPLGGPDPLKTRIELASDWFAEGFATREYDPDKVSGYHALKLAIFVDEASGVNDLVLDALEGLMSSGDPRMLMIGNTIRSSGRFREAFKPGSIWKRFVITAWATPNFTETGITEDDIRDGETWKKKLDHWQFNHPGKEMPAPYLVSPVWVDERARAWGIESTMYRVRVNAEFPPDGADEDRVIPASLAMAAQEREFPEDAEKAPIEMGVDVGRYGEDASIITARAGRQALLEKVAPRNLMKLVGEIVHLGRDVFTWQRVQKIKVDVIGMGGGPVDRLRELQDEGEIPDHVEIIGVNVAMSPKRIRKPGFPSFVTHRDELWWEMRELMRTGQVGGTLGDKIIISELAMEELTEPTYIMTSKAQVKVEAKEELRKPHRLGRSPDRGDAWNLAFVDCLDERPRPVKIRIKSSVRR